MTSLKNTKAQAWEKVYTVTDYYDGPRRGVADFCGQPHIYESRFEDIDSPKRDTFLLTPIDDETLSLALESWAIWRRWETAFHRGDTSQETHPALPHEKARSDELDRILTARIKIDPTNCREAYADFQRREDSGWSGLGGFPLEVYWTSKA